MYDMCCNDNFNFHFDDHFESRLFRRADCTVEDGERFQPDELAERCRKFGQIFKFRQAQMS